MIEQIRFSEIIKKFLQDHFVEFVPSISYNDDGSFDCHLRSLTDSFSIWLATYNSEITIGVEDPDGKTDIHTHISFYEDEDSTEALTQLSKMINEIREDKLVLYKDKFGDYHLTKNILEKKKDSNNIFFSWK